MQTFTEKAAILKIVADAGGSLEDVEIFMGETWDNVQDQPQYILNNYYQIRIKHKTLTRTITTPLPVTLEWAKENPTALVCGYINLSLRKACEYTDHFIESGLVFHTTEDAEAALKAFTESMK